jgi:gamma-glutamylputrescine oxidase
MILQDWWYTTLADVQEINCPPLRQDIETDVVVVGGGIAGLSAALELAKNGRKVAILERNICGGSSTGKSSGFLTPDSELELSQLIRRYGKAGAARLWNAATSGVDTIRAVVREHDIDCDLQSQDCLFLANDDAALSEIAEEEEARAALGFNKTRYARQDVPRVIGSTAYHGALRYSGTYAMNPLRYAQALKKVLLDRGVQIFESSEVTELDGHTVKTHLASATGAQIVFCIDKMRHEMSHYADNVYHAQTFLSITAPLKDSEIAKMFPDGTLQCWDSDLVYSYFRLTGDNRLLLGGGSTLTTFAKEDTDSPSVISHVIKKFRKKFPLLDAVEFMQFWPGRIDTTRDLMPTVVKDPGAPHVHYVLGCVGLPWATLCGTFVARQIVTPNDPETHDLYYYFNPNRKFFMPLWTEKILGKAIVFSLNNAWAKYYQVEEKNTGAQPLP